MPYNVYVIELRSEVLEKSRFRNKNPDRREDKPCVYVGQTARSPEERFEQHLGGIRANSFARDYGFSLKPRLYRNLQNYETRPETEQAERRLGERLRRRGYAVWWGQNDDITGAAI
jgi:hypothetical protein